MIDNISLNLHKPENLDDLYINDEIINKLKKMYKDKIIDSTIFYGPEGSGKYTIIKALLASIYGCSVNNIKRNEYHLTNPNTKKSEIINIKMSKFHYEIDMRDYYLNDSLIINLFIDNVSKTCNIETNSYHIIIIKNTQLISKSIQDSIKAFIEKKHNTCRIIFITTEYYKISDSIKSRCIGIRIPHPKKSDIAKLTVKTLEKNNIKIEVDNLKEIIDECNSNLNKLSIILQNIIIAGKYIKFEDKYKELILSIPKYFKKKKIIIFQEIRNILMNILICNVQPKFIFYTLLNFYLESDYSDSIKREILESVCDYELKCSNGYRQLYHIEAFIVKIATILEKYE